jgi:hypothetical protein
MLDEYSPYSDITDFGRMSKRRVWFLHGSHTTTAPQPPRLPQPSPHSTTTTTPLQLHFRFGRVGDIVADGPLQLHDRFGRGGDIDADGPLQPHLRFGRLEDIDASGPDAAWGLCRPNWHCDLSPLKDVDVDTPL